MLTETLNIRLKQKQEAEQYRCFIDKEAGTAVQPVYNATQYLAFNSNDYLGLSHHPAILKAAADTLYTMGLGSGSAHLIAGHSQWHTALETKLAHYLQCERSLLFSSGYLANLGLLQALTQKNDLILQDKLNHASLLDARLLTQATTQRYTHLNLTSLENKLQQRHAYNQCFIVTDSVFSMDGDLANLPKLVQLAKQYRAFLIIDDAHAFGVLGANGLGSLEHFNLLGQPNVILMATLGKAVGTAGAFVASSNTIIETLIQFARTYIYTTASPAALAAATCTSLDLITSYQPQRVHLQQLITTCQKTAKTYNLPLQASQTPIQPLIFNDSVLTLSIANQLKKHGYLVTAIRPPTVPHNTARLRITLSVDHSCEQVEQLITNIAKIYYSLKKRISS